MMGNTKRTFAVSCVTSDLQARGLLCETSGQRLILLVRCLPIERPLWRPLCLNKEKVSSNASLLNLLQFSRDLAQHSQPVVHVFCDENIHYRVCKMMYAEKTTGWNVCLFLQYEPILYGFWHAYKFSVTQTFAHFGQL